MPPKIQAATAATRIETILPWVKLIRASIPMPGMRLAEGHYEKRSTADTSPVATSQAFSPPILQTSFHSASVTGCTDRRPYFTSAMPLSFGSALIAASVTGFGSGLSATVVTATHGSPLAAVGSGNDSRVTSAMPTTCFSSPVWWKKNLSPFFISPRWRRAVKLRTPVHASPLAPRLTWSFQEYSSGSVFNSQYAMSRFRFEGSCQTRRDGLVDPLFSRQYRGDGA